MNTRTKKLTPGDNSSPASRVKIDQAERLGRPKGFSVNIRALSISAGAGFIVVLTGNIMRMPGLPKKPAAEQVDITSEGKITGLF